MSTVKKTVAQIRDLVRSYPTLLTATEVVGRCYLLLDELPGVKDKVAFLIDHLTPIELSKVIAAAREVFDACDSFAAGGGFHVGAVIVPVERDGAEIALDDREIPGQFVKDLMNCSGSTKERPA